MRVVTVGSPQALAEAAADWTMTHLKRTPRAALALPTGQTPLGFYAELCRRASAREIALAETRVFNLDEYLGVPAHEPHSYAAFLHRHLIDPLQLAPVQVRLLRGDAPDPAAECQAYDAAIAECGGIDLCVLGLGANGHIAFNEPMADWTQGTHVVELSAVTRITHSEQLADGWPVPQHGITMGIRTLLESRHALLLIAGAGKRAARDALQRGVADRQWPVTSLLGHTDLTVIELD